MDIFLTLFSSLFILFSSSTNYNSNDIRLNYFEYNRGMSLPTIAQIHISYEGGWDYTFHNVYMEDLSFFPDNSIIPNAFFEPLFQGDIVNAVKATTEPYYGIRYYHFFKNNPNFGIGIDFIHFKVFVPSDSEYQIHITGTDENGNSVDMWAPIHDYIAYFNVSHGVNHVTLSATYRMMLLPDENIPEGRIQPYVALSFGPCIPHPELKLTGDTERSAYSYQIGFPNFGFGLNLGTRFQFFKHFGFYLEYKFTATWLYGMYFDNGVNGTIQTRFTDNHFVWGLFVAF